MADDKAQPEPSMEDILASIRRILSEEEAPEAAPAAAAPAAAPAPASKAQDWGASGAKDGAPGAKAQAWGDKPVDGPGADKKAWAEKPAEGPGGKKEAWADKAAEGPGGKKEAWAEKPVDGPGAGSEKWDDKEADGPDADGLDWADPETKVGGGAQSQMSAPGPRGTRADEDGDVLELTEDMLSQGDGLGEEMAETAVRIKPRMDEMEDSMPAESARGSPFSQLTRAVAKRSQSMASDRNLPLGNGGVTLEAMVREILNDLLKEWMAQNLPPMVDKIVKKEIQRLAAEAD